MKILPALALGVSCVLLSVACGDDHDTRSPDAGMMPDMSMPGMDVGDPMFTWPTPQALDIASGGPDQLMAAAPGPSGTFYVAGFAATTPDGTKYVIVGKLGADGLLDTDFGTNGVYTSDVEFKGGSDEIDLVVQSDGKIVVSATVANDVDANDTDVGLFRVDADGALDTTFGDNGFARVDLSTAHDTGTELISNDRSRGLAVGPSDALFLHAIARGEPRTDTDFTVARLSADGELDTTYAGGDGKFQLDFAGANAEANATARGLHVLADGSVIAGGYANAPGIGSTQAVLYRLDPDGALDADFASGGVFYDTVLAAQTEIYNFAIDDDRITTAGYGRDQTAGKNVWVSLRFDTTTGARDTSFGGATNGAVLVDPSGGTDANNCRSALGLPGGKTVLIGSTGGSTNRDAALAILTQDGKLDTTYGTGVTTFSLGGAGGQWWGAAVSGGKLLVVGFRAVDTQTAGENDNSYRLLLDLE